MIIVDISDIKQKVVSFYISVLGKLHILLVLCYYTTDMLEGSLSLFIFYCYTPQLKYVFRLEKNVSCVLVKTH